MDLFKKTLGPVERVMKDAKLTISDVDEVVLVGGSTRIPKVIFAKRRFQGTHRVDVVNAFNIRVVECRSHVNAWSWYDVPRWSAQLQHMLLTLSKGFNR